MTAIDEVVWEFERMNDKSYSKDEWEFARRLLANLLIDTSLAMNTEENLNPVLAEAYKIKKEWEQNKSSTRGY